MKNILNVFLLILLLTHNACTQNIKEKLYGSWSLISDNEFPDLIIFRSDHKYFVYNSNSVATESIGLTENLKSDDIWINNAYTSMTEKGIWSFEPSTKELVLKERKILETWTDFSEAYGKSSELRFYLKEITDSVIQLCFNKEGKQLCDKYERSWSYTSNKNTKIFYTEVFKEYAGTGIKTKEVLLSGYETELKLSCEFYDEPDELIIYDHNGKELYRSGMMATIKKEVKTINLSGITKLIFKIDNKDFNSKWKFSVEIK